MRKKSSNTSAGFTLIEVLLSLAIFTIIGVATVRHIQQLQETKIESFERVDLYDSVRAAVSLIRADLTQAFHIPFTQLGQNNVQALRQNLQVPHTVFDGRKNELIFTSLSHRNFYADRRECEQTEISYFLHQAGTGRAPALMKRESGMIDGDPYSGGRVVKLLDNINYLQFQYWDPESDKWVEDWTSEQGMRTDKFPSAVQMVLRIDAPNGKEGIQVKTSFKISFPNNTPVLVQF